MWGTRMGATQTELGILGAPGRSHGRLWSVVRTAATAFSSGGLMGGGGHLRLLLSMLPFRSWDFCPAAIFVVVLLLPLRLAAGQRAQQCRVCCRK